MPIDVMNHMWVQVCAAAYVAQLADEARLKGNALGIAALEPEAADRFMGEAMTIADMALPAYTRVCEDEKRARER